MALPRITVDANLPNHPKSLALAAVLKDPRAWTYVAEFWMWASQNEPKGLIRGPMARVVVEHALKWTGNPDLLVESMIRVGWLDVTPDGIEIHGWKEHAGAHIAKAQRDAERMRDFRETESKRYGSVREQSPNVREQCANVHEQDANEDVTDANEKRTFSGNLGNSNSNSNKNKKTKKKPLSAEPTAPTVEAPATDIGPPSREQLVFEHWVGVMKMNARTAFDDKRRKAVEARFADGYSLEDLKLAVDGCALTPHNMGTNDRNEKYNDLELICRDAGHVDRFIQNAQSPPKLPEDKRQKRVAAEDINPDLFKEFNQDALF